MHDLHYMHQALELAQKAQAENEVPVGAILVANNEIIASAWNQPIKHCDPTAHAEILALRQAAQAVKNYRLIDTTLYVTLEPCIMCAGAIIHARVGRIVFGAFDPKAGAVSSVFNILDQEKLNHRVEYEGGVLADECGQILKDFFQAKRK